MKQCLNMRKQRPGYKVDIAEFVSSLNYTRDLAHDIRD